MNLFHKLEKSYPKIHCLVYCFLLGIIGIFFFFAFMFEKIKSERIVQESFHEVYDDLAIRWKKVFKKN